VIVRARTARIFLSICFLGERWISRALGYLFGFGLLFVSAFL
jgi:hypothetical protein